MKQSYFLHKTKLLLVAALLTLPFIRGHAQYNLTSTTNYGNIPPNYVTTDLITAGTQIIAGSLAANTWSAQQTLPFAFSFYGVPVSTYYVSANGVLTFAAATPGILPAGNTTLPSASIPDMSIAGMWDEFTNAPPTGSNDVVRVSSYGTAPNRQVWISWYSFETGNPNLSFAYWSIVLEETTNNIYVTDQYSNTGSATGVTVGLQKDITTAISAANSPNILAQGNGTALTDNDVWFFQYLGPPCSGMPASGITAGPSPVCPGVSSTFTVTGATIASSIIYQWQSSTNGGASWSDIVGATNSNYVAPITTAQSLRRRDVCTATNDTAYSAPLAVTVNNFMNCYCTSIPGFASDEEIYNVTINGGSTDPLYSNANGCTTVAPGPGSILGRYSNFMSLPAISSAAPGQTVSFSIVQDECDGATYYANGIAMWIDFNQNGSFSDPGEQVFVEATTATGPRTINGTFTIPLTATTGNTAVRIICAEGISGAGLQPCMTYNYGETEDYLFNIQCPTLTGAGVVDQGICSNSSATFTGTPSFSGATISWWDAAIGGNQVGAGNTFTTPSLTSTTTYYVQEDFPACPSSPRDTIQAIVTAVSVTLVPIDATCNGLDDGSFIQTAAACGTGPFEYSLDNGVTFSPAIPTNLTAGTYFIIVRDATLATSAPIQVIIGQPTAPTALTATNVTYFNATLGWTAMGSETSWVVEYGPAGFTPGTGTVVTTSSNPLNITGLTEDTDYEFYVAAGCAPGSAVAGPFAFSTNAGFYTYDNACGPGFIDISATGTNLNLTDDSEAGVTLPWSWSVNGTTVNTITIGNNGGVLFNTLTGFVGYTASGNGFFPFVQDLNTANPGGGVFWESIGTAPNRQFVIQWQDIPHYTFPAATNGVTFQLIHDEATNETYFIYQDVDFGNPIWDLGADAEIAANTPAGNVVISTNNTAYLTNSSCVHLYNALCPNVTAFTSLIFQEDAIFDWNPGAYGETDWTLVYGAPGFDPAVPGQELGTYNLGSSDFSFSGVGVTLTQLTEYDVYIYSECAADNLTSPGFFFNFTTLPFCSNPATLSGNTDVDSINMAWNWIESSPDYPVESFNIQYGQTGFTLYTGTEIVAVGTNNADTVVDASLMGGGVYQVYVQAVCTDLLNGGTDTSAYIGPFTVVMPLTTDTVCGAELLQVDGTQYIFNNTGGTVSPGEATIAPPATGAQTTDGWINSTLNRTTWYKFVAPASGSVRVNATGIAYNGQIAVYDVANCADFLTNFDLLAANDDEIGGSSLAPNFTVCGLTPGNEYYIMHDGFDATAGNHSIILTEIVLEAGNANALSQICYGETLNLFTTINGYEAGGAWSAPVAAANASITDSIFNSTGLAYQTFVFQYRVTDGCAYDSITSQVQIFAPSSAGTDGALTVCKNEPFDLLSGLGGNVDLGGTWYDPSNNALPSSMIDHASAFPGSFNYDYITGNGVCPDDTANVVVTVSASCDYFGIEEAVFADVQVYPNPSTGVIFVETTINTGAFDYSVTDANGRVVAQANNGIKAAATSTINLTGVERGIYFVKLSNASADKVYRIVIQ